MSKDRLPATCAACIWQDKCETDGLISNCDDFTPFEEVDDTDAVIEQRRAEFAEDWAEYLAEWDDEV